jgi:hypothetical protein
MSTWHPSDDGFRARQDAHEARLEAQRYVEWMRQRGRQEVVDYQLQALSDEVRRLREELDGLRGTVESLLDDDADVPSWPRCRGPVTELEDGSIIPF